MPKWLLPNSNHRKCVSCSNVYEKFAVYTANGAYVSALESSPTFAYASISPLQSSKFSSK